MRLSWDEIKRRARAFSAEWADAHYERGETQSFYNDFFGIFGVNRRQVASYEQRVKLLDNRHGFMDLFWPKVLLVEQKSAGLDLRKAGRQSLDYVDGIRAEDQPRYVLTCDFQKWNLLDLESGRTIVFRLPDLHKHIEAFDFMLGRRTTFTTQASVTIKAAELMGKLHDALEDSGYTGHDLEMLLVRLLFCLFADDTGIFQPKDIFLSLIDSDTDIDGRNVGRMLGELFDVLDTPDGQNGTVNQRQSGLSGELNAFPYVNGALFTGHVRTPVFDATMRTLLLDAARHDWSGVSPAIFGSLFQSVMSPKERRAKGAHYTSEANILKVIGPLFLDELQAELARLVTRKTGRNPALIEFQHKLARLTFFDPACGCGNFLVVAYREIRRLELECLKALYGDQMTDVSLLSRVTVDQFYGIEYEEFPARIAEVAMWMADHLANNELNEAFRLNYARIPLRESAHIRHGDALEVDWADVLPPEKCSYVMGNPPFVGKKEQSRIQKDQLKRVVGGGDSFAILDYVAAWFLKAGAYVNGAGGGRQRSHPQPLHEVVEGNHDPRDATPLPDFREGLGVGSSPSANRRIRIAFVSTNSITQGEQVAQLWPILFDRYHLEIAFAHRTFSWGSEARGKAHVHVVIIGLTHADNEPEEKRLFSYPDIKGDPVESRHGALTAYLFDARGVANRHLVAVRESSSLSGAPRICVGTKPVDGGHYIFDAAERQAFLAKEPGAAKAMRPFLGGYEFINGEGRWLLHVADLSPAQQRAMPEVRDRIAKVREYRSNSAGNLATSLAGDPSTYHVTVIPKSPFLVIPEVSSERREYVPIGWIEPPTIPSNQLLVIQDATLLHFAVLTSRAHMAWLAHIGGRLKSDFRYSSGLVYNTFPWPDAPPAQRSKVEALAQAVLDARAAHPTASLADLYDPDTMPADLRRAHAALDGAVDRLYRPAAFASDRDRVEHLFGRYEALVNPLERVGIAKNRRVAKKTGV